MICADCGRELFWDERVVCRVKYMDGTNNIVRSCDYHYVEGEVQRHYPEKENP